MVIACGPSADNAFVPACIKIWNLVSYFQALLDDVNLNAVLGGHESLAHLQMICSLYV